MAAKAPTKAGVPSAVIAVVKAWAGARAADGDRVLHDGRLTLEALLRPVLVDEVAEITAEQLLIALDLPQGAANDDKPVPFLGMELSQEQGKRAAQWLTDQQGLAAALGLDMDAWSKKLGDGFARTLETLRGKPLGDVAAGVASQLQADPLKTAAAGFTGGVDPSKSEQAGLRGILAARTFKK